MSCGPYGGGSCVTVPTTTPSPSTTTTSTTVAKTPSTLPFTGGDVAGLAIIGAAFVLAGAAVVGGMRQRRREIDAALDARRRA
jgi:uncharacterized protein HemX